MIQQVNAVSYATALDVAFFGFIREIIRNFDGIVLCIPFCRMPLEFSVIIKTSSSTYYNKSFQHYFTKLHKLHPVWLAHITCNMPIGNPSCSHTSLFYELPHSNTVCMENRYRSTDRCVAFMSEPITRGRCIVLAQDCLILPAAYWINTDLVHWVGTITVTKLHASRPRKNFTSLTARLQRNSKAL
jgi:hypothetical protein